jgi:hypothetical protein
MWKELLLEALERKKAAITFDPHLFERAEERMLSLEKIEGTVRAGRIVGEKCEAPNKLCFCRYYGKENESYMVIARFHRNFIEVKTAWLRKGR